MKILNLANEGTGTYGKDDESKIHTDIRFKFKNFPDGQVDIVINPEDVIHNIPVQITSHFNSAEDLLKIMCARVALNKLQVKEIHLFIPYVLGARSDRRFEKGGTSYLVDIVAPIINLQKFESVTCFDAHSDVAQACIDRLDVITNVDLVKWAIHDLQTTTFRIAAPDQGATKKVFELTHQLQIESNILFCVKHRDQITGKILHTEVPLGTIVPDMDYIIVDDICDGGRTFIEIAKEIKRQYTEAKTNCRIFLVVSHGIFSNDFNELNRHLDGIYTTNSITSYGWSVKMLNQAPKNLHVMDVIHTKINQNK